MAAKNKRKRRPAIEVATPTDEQLNRGEYRRANHGHYRKVPVIDTMLARDQITPQGRLAGTAFADDGQEVVVLGGLVHRFTDVANVAADIHILSTS